MPTKPKAKGKSGPVRLTGEECPKCGSTESKRAFRSGTKMKCAQCGKIWRPSLSK